MGRVTISEEASQRLAAQVAARRGAGWLQRIHEAAAALGDVALTLLDGVEAPQLVVVAGVGKSGAVGIATARRLQRARMTVHLVLSAPASDLNEMAAHQLALARRDGLEPWGLALSEAAMAATVPIPWRSADLLIDALLGSGIEGNPRGESADLIRLMNAARRPILALDRPSGLLGDEGLILSPSVEATATLALGALSHLHREGWPIVGELWLADLHATAEDFAALGLPAPTRDTAPHAVHHIGSARLLTA